MKKLIIMFFILSGVFIALLLGLLILRHLNSGKTIDETRTVFIKKTENGFQLFRNEKPFYIKGAGGNAYLKELAQVGGNTIRLYDTLNLSVLLDEAEKYKLAVIVDIPIPAYNKNYNYYENEDYYNGLKQKIKDLVRKNKNHPALLMWNLGNELHYPFVLWKNSFINSFNELITIIQSEDPNHPVLTATAGVSRKAMASIYFHSPQVDLLSFNSFGGTKNFNANIDQISIIFGEKPYFFSELGSDGPWEAQRTAWGAQIEQTSTKKAEHYHTRYNFIKNNKDKASLGSLVFYWGKKLECTYTWFSLFNDDYKSEIIKEIKNVWSETNITPVLIGLEYMLVNGKGAYDNIILQPDMPVVSELKFSDNKMDNIRIHWEICPEELHTDTGYVNITFNKEINSLIDVYNNKATFITPSTEGPYRIFAYIYDQDGYFATTNTPFYVLNSK